MINIKIIPPPRPPKPIKTLKKPILIVWRYNKSKTKIINVKPKKLEYDLYIEDID